MSKKCDLGSALPSLLRILGTEFLSTLCKLEYDPIPKLPTSRRITQVKDMLADNIFTQSFLWGKAWIV